jgi:hypothetical protein
MRWSQQTVVDLLSQGHKFVRTRPVHMFYATHVSDEEPAPDPTSTDMRIKQLS